MLILSCKIAAISPSKRIACPLIEIYIEMLDVIIGLVDAFYDYLLVLV